MRWCQEERLETGMSQESKYVKGGAAPRLSHHLWRCGQKQSPNGCGHFGLESASLCHWPSLDNTDKLEKVIQATFKQFTYLFLAPSVAFE